LLRGRSATAARRHRPSTSPRRFEEECGKQLRFGARVGAAGKQTTDGERGLLARGRARTTAPAGRPAGPRGARRRKVDPTGRTRSFARHRARRSFRNDLMQLLFLEGRKGVPYVARASASGWASRAGRAGSVGWTLPLDRRRGRASPRAAEPARGIGAHFARTARGHGRPGVSSSGGRAGTARRSMQSFCFSRPAVGLEDVVAFLERGASYWGAEGGGARHRVVAIRRSGEGWSSRRCLLFL